MEDDSAAQERLRQLNPRGGVPTFDIDGMVMAGFSPDGLENAIDQAVRRRTVR